jgi:hypothetical protein
VLGGMRPSIGARLEKETRAIEVIDLRLRTGR